MNFVRGELASAGDTGAAVKLATGEVIVTEIDARRAATGEAVTLGIRPEHVALARYEGPVGPGTLDIRVKMIEHLGDVSIVYLERETVDGVPLTVKRDGAAPVERGDRVMCAFPAGQCHVFDANGEAFPRI